MSEQEALDKRLLDLLHEKPELYDLAIKMLEKGIEDGKCL